mmetsp:Transcript_151698/g.265078  ORF Transcript_151698/g.265078 Transcript_151698/m.265078 type:complete len:102 (+) Transcript_151698:659-964(+)
MGGLQLGASTPNPQSTVFTRPMDNSHKLKWYTVWVRVAFYFGAVPQLGTSRHLKRNNFILSPTLLTECVPCGSGILAVSVSCTLAAHLPKLVANAAPVNSG